MAESTWRKRAAGAGRTIKRPPLTRDWTVRRWIARLSAAMMAIAVAAGLPGCGGGEQPDDDTSPALRVSIEPTTVVARHNESVTLRVDVPDVPDADLPSGYAFDLDEVGGDIGVTTVPCPPGAGSRACQDWTITPRAGAVPGRYDVHVRTVGSRAGAGSGGFSLEVVASPSPAFGSAVGVSAGRDHVLVLNDAGRVFVLGYSGNAQARLGYRRQPVPGVDYSAREDVLEPSPVTEFVEAPLPPQGRWLGVTAARDHSFAVRDDGSVWAWGENKDEPGLGFRSEAGYQADSRPVPGLSNVRAVTIGSLGSSAVQSARHSALALLADGNVWGWRADNAPPGPKCVLQGFDDCLAFATDVRAMAQHPHTVLDAYLQADGSVWLGNRRITGVPEPVVSIAITGGHELVMAAADGSVWMYEGGTLTQLAGLSDIVALSVRGDSSSDIFALRRDGSVWTWVNSDITPDARTPRPIAGLANIVALGGHFAISGDCASGGALWRIDRGGVAQQPRAVRVPGFGEGPGCTPPPTVGLNLSVSGQGRIVSAPAGIDCGSSCSAAFARGTELRLLAAPAPGSKFDRWVGDGCAEVVVATSSLVCEAVFVAGGERRLTLRVLGGGRVTSEPPGIDCATSNAGDCRQSYEVNTAVALATAPALGYRLDRTTGHADCADGALMMNGVRSCVAVFAPLPAPAAPAGFNAASAVNGVQLRWDAVNGPVMRYRLERADASGTYFTIDDNIDGTASSAFDGSALPNTGYTYRLTALNVSGASAPVTASVITVPPVNARLSLTVSGNGAVTSVPAGIDCTAGAGDCSEVYAINTQVVLTATPGAGQRLQGFGGDPDCADGVVTLVTDLTCSASFVAVSGQGWVQLGGAPVAFSTVASATSIAIDAGAVPHLASTEAAPGDVTRLRVRRFDGTAWQTLGAALNAGAITPASAPSLAFSPGGVLHVAWSQGNGIQQDVFVARFNGAAWESVGSAGAALNYVANSRAIGPSLAFDAGALPMLAWIEDAVVKFKRWTGTAWVPAQGAGSAQGPASNAADRVRLSSAPAGVPVIAWTEGSGTARALNVVRDFDFSPLGSRVNAPLPEGTVLSDFGVLGGVPDSVSTVTWAERSPTAFTLRASRWDGQWIAFAPILNASTDSLASFAMARGISAVAYSTTSAGTDTSSLQVATRTSGFTFDAFGTPLTAARSAVLRPIAFEMASATRPLIAGIRTRGDLYELHVYGYFP